MRTTYFFKKERCVFLYTLSFIANGNVSTPQFPFPGSYKACFSQDYIVPWLPGLAYLAGSLLMSSNPITVASAYHFAKQQEPSFTSAFNSISWNDYSTTYSIIQDSFEIWIKGDLWWWLHIRGWPHKAVMWSIQGHMFPMGQEHLISKRKVSSGTDKWKSWVSILDSCHAKELETCLSEVKATIHFPICLSWWHEKRPHV